MEISEPAEYALLGLLWNGPRHGYELGQAFAANQELGAICRLKQSQLYACLKKLEQLAYLEGTLEPQEGRPPKRVECITDAGRQVFRQWVEAPVLRPREVQFLFLLKLYFARSFGAETIRRLTARQIEACEGSLKKLQGEPTDTLMDREDDNSIEAIDSLQDFPAIVRLTRARQIEGTIHWLIELSGQADTIADAL